MQERWKRCKKELGIRGEARSGEKGGGRRREVGEKGEKSKGDIGAYIEWSPTWLTRTDPSVLPVDYEAPDF